RAVRIAHDERIDYMLYRGAFIHSPAVVRTILEGAVWVDVEDSPDVEGPIDVSSALLELNGNERRLLALRFGRPDSEWRGVITDAEYVTIERAIDKISMILNRGASRTELDKIGRASCRGWG